MKKTALILIIIVLMIMTAGFLQWGFDSTPLGEAGEMKEDFPAAASLLEFLGGIRQYIAYTLYIKTDNLHHAYYGSFDKEAELVPYFMLIALLDPHYVHAYFEGSAIIYAQGLREQAIEFNLQGIRANPESADLYVSLADLYLQEKRYEDARDAFEEAMKYEPKIVNRNLILSGISAAYHATGDDVMARKILMEQAIYNQMSIYDQDIDDELRAQLVYMVNTELNSAIPEGSGGGTE
ncbi:MAG: tetratricopeptide repeat protein [Actinomycetota bacterium]|nr:tetratricopeptide repeat protein [Actinomycetota bacterium]